MSLSDNLFVDDAQFFDAGELVVRRKRKRHTISGFCWCQDSNLDFNDVSLPGSENLLVAPELDIPSTNVYVLFQASPGFAAYVPMNYTQSADNPSQQSVFHSAALETHTASSETQVQMEDDSLDMAVEAVVAADVFRCQDKARKPRIYKAKLKTPSDLDDDAMTVEAIDDETLQLRSRRIRRIIVSQGSLESDLSAPGHRSRGRKSRKQGQKPLAERLVDAVVTPSSQPNDELFQEAGRNNGGFRTPLRMEAVLRSPTVENSRKRALVDPRKVATPFHPSTFKTRERMRMAETPTSYERTARRFATSEAKKAKNVDTVVHEFSPAWLEEPQDHSRPKQTKVRFSEPTKLELAAMETPDRVKGIRKSRSKAAKSKPKAKTSRVRVLRDHMPQAIHGLDTGRKPLAMIPIPMRSHTSRPSLDIHAGMKHWAQTVFHVDPGTTRFDELLDRVTLNNGSQLQTTRSAARLSAPVSVVSELSASQVQHSSPIMSPNEGVSQVNTDEVPRPTLKSLGSFLDDLRETSRLVAVKAQ